MPEATPNDLGATQIPARCNCDWLDDAPEFPCGCGKEQVRLYRDSAWHYAWKHWRSACLIDKLSRDLEEARQTLRKALGVEE